MRYTILRSAVFIFLFSLCCFILHAQGVAINNTGSPPDSLAMLDVKSNSKGFLPPRLTVAQRTTLSASLTTAQAGMQVADATTGRPCYWTGTKWSILGYGANAPVYFNVVSNTLSLNAGTAAGDLLTWDGNNWVNMQPAYESFSITYDNRQPSLALSYCIALNGIYPSRNSDEPFVGEIQLFAFGFAPNGYSFCNGALLPISQHTALFSLLGTYYGGNGQTTFALPDLRGRVAINYGQGPGLTDRPLGESAGTETNTITH